MSDTYEVDGVKITPLGGGFYELRHPSIADPVKERGKEAAEAKAKEIAAAAAPADGSMEPQGDLSGTTQAAIDAHAASVAAEQKAPSDEEASKEVDTAKDDEIAALKDKLSRAEAENDKLKEAAADIRTVITEGEPDKNENRVPNAVPRQFNGEMDASTKKALKKMGVGTTTIILEENEDIPPTGLFIGHNGRGYMISPGEKVDVPNFLLGVLDDAVTSSPITDSKTRKVLGYRSRMKYPYRRV